MRSESIQADLNIYDVEGNLITRLNCYEMHTRDAVITCIGWDCQIEGFESASLEFRERPGFRLLVDGEEVSSETTAAAMATANRVVMQVPQDTKIKISIRARADNSRVTIVVPWNATVADAKVALATHLGIPTEELTLHTYDRNSSRVARRIASSNALARNEELYMARTQNIPIPVYINTCGCPGFGDYIYLEVDAHTTVRTLKENLAQSRNMRANRLELRCGPFHHRRIANDAENVATLLGSNHQLNIELVRTSISFYDDDTPEQTTNVTPEQTTTDIPISVPLTGEASPLLPNETQAQPSKFKYFGGGGFIGGIIGALAGTAISGGLGYLTQGTKAGLAFSISVPTSIILGLTVGGVLYARANDGCA